MKHTPTLKGLSSEDIFKIINSDDNLEYIQVITNAVNMHESLINTLKADLRVFKALAVESNDAAIRRSIFDIEEILSQAERK